jgi:hypothetical protein
VCFPKGPSQAETQAAADQRIEADDIEREAVEDTSNKKRDDIQSALESRAQRKGQRGGTGRRSLFKSSSGGAGYLARFE